MAQDPRKLAVDADIRSAWTLPAHVYTDPGLYAAQLERVFVPSWQLIPDLSELRSPGDVRPWTLLPAALDEPLLLTRDADGTLRCLSNVCTHRGHPVVTEAGSARGLRCGYHGRRFGLDGRFLSMPEFDQVRDFPCASDDLPQLPLERWGPLGFTSIRPEAASFDGWIGPLRERLRGYPVERLALDPAGCRDYTIAAHWALYCDNYLEGFHIPFVHAALARELDWDAYRTELLPLGTLQIGIAATSDGTLTLPDDHPDAGSAIAAYYFWLFPNLMINVYPWGLSVNLVEPGGLAATRVRYFTWTLEGAFRDRGAGADLHGVELEDQAVVEGVQRGVRSRLYTRGRLSPSQERGVHHFHRLLAERLAGETP